MNGSKLQEAGLLSNRARARNTGRSTAKRGGLNFRGRRGDLGSALIADVELDIGIDRIDIASSGHDGGGDGSGRVALGADGRECEEGGRTADASGGGGVDVERFGRHFC